MSDEVKRRNSTMSADGKVAAAAVLQIDDAEFREIHGGPGKCGKKFIRYWNSKGKDPSEKIPHVDVKFKVYRLSTLDQKEGTFFVDFILMLDWIDESLELAAEPPDFADHFWPRGELLNLAAGEDAMDFDDAKFKPKYKKDKHPKFGRTVPLGDNKVSVHRACITIKVRRTIFARLDFHEFPFDKQVLELTIKLLSVRVLGSQKEVGVRPKTKHPTRWRGTKKEGGHELLAECDCLPEFAFVALNSKAYSSKFGPGVDMHHKTGAKEMEERAALNKQLATAIADESYYQDQYTLQLVMVRDPV